MKPDSSTGDVLLTLTPLEIALGGQTVSHIDALTLRSGERWWVRGPNGSGKSSLLRLLAGELWPAPGQHEHRLYHFDGEPSWSPMAAKGRMALLNPERQNRYLHQDWDLTAAEVVATGFLNTDLLHERPQPEECERLRELMQDLDIAPLWSRPFLELSQGERRRVLIARALATDPDVLLLDEFAEGLDETSRRVLWDLLKHLADQGKTIVLTTHRPGPALEGWHAFDVEPLAPLPTEAPAAPSPAESEAPTFPQDVPLFHAQGDLYLEGQLLLEALDWRLEQGEHTAILGPNGCGKTSFLRLLWGELHLAFGGKTVHFGDPELTVPEIRRSISYFQPDMHAWFRPNQEVQNILLSGLFSTIDLFDPVTEAHRRTMRAAAQDFDLEPFLERPFATLSYGQARRVLLARALIGRPRLALLDEPFDGLDRHIRPPLFAYLERAARPGGTTFVLTCHHAEDLPPWLRQHWQFTRDRQLQKLRD